MPRPNPLRLPVQILCALLSALGAAAVAAWLLGRITGDRWAPGQWLLWIPTPAMLPALVLGLLGALGPARRPRLRRPLLWAWVVLAAAIAVYFSLFEHRLLRGAPDPAGLRIAHWNMMHTRSDDEAARHVESVLDLMGDVTILVHGWGVMRRPALLESLPDDVTPFISGRLGVFSRLPIIEFRPIVSRDEIEVYLLRIDAAQRLGRTLVIHVIDLPSDPHRPRMQIARDVRRMLAEAGAPTPDIVVGDCNMTRGSASLAALAPGMHHAFDEGGHGYAASFHRAFPLYHIDHILLAESLRCVRYDLTDPGVGRHCAQTAWIVGGP